MEKREAQQLIEFLSNGEVETGLHLLRWVVRDYEGEEAAVKEQRCEFRDSCSCPECEEAKASGWVELDHGALEQRKKDAETPADDYDWEDDDDDRGWLTYGERMEQQGGH